MKNAGSNIRKAESNLIDYFHFKHKAFQAALWAFACLIVRVVSRADQRIGSKVAQDTSVTFETVV